MASREGSSRAPSSRATNLKEEKKKRSEEVLKKLRECREDSKGIIVKGCGYFLLL